MLAWEPGADTLSLHAVWITESRRDDFMLNPGLVMATRFLIYGLA